MNSPLSSRSGSPDLEIGLKDIWQISLANWPLMLVSLLAAVVSAGIYLHAASAEYEAILTIEIGQVTTIDSVHGLEPSSTTVARMRSPEFVNRIVAALGWKDDPRESLLIKSYTVSPVPSSERYIRISARSYSGNDARRVVEAAFSEIVRLHDKIAVKLESDSKQRLYEVNSSISDIRALLNQISDVESKLLSPVDAIELQVTAIRERGNLRALELRQAAEGSLQISKTTATEILTPQQPVLPNKRRVMVFAAFVGFFAGVLAISTRALLLSRN
jgi:uncharacterized protein involved in exopolysaccharide biosynthesis